MIHYNVVAIKDCISCSFSVRSFFSSHSVYLYLKPYAGENWELNHIIAFRNPRVHSYPTFSTSALDMLDLLWQAVSVFTFAVYLRYPVCWYSVFVYSRCTTKCDTVIVMYSRCSGCQSPIKQDFASNILLVLNIAGFYDNKTPKNPSKVIALKSYSTVWLEVKGKG